jgi:hypothetical protein
MRRLREYLPESKPDNEANTAAEPPLLEVDDPGEEE